MRYKKIAAVMGICIVAMGMNGCAQLQGNQKELGETTKLIDLDFGYALSENGMLWRGFDSKIHYLDFSTDTEVLLCNREGCDHTTRDCDADIFDIQAVNAVFYDGQIYMLCMPTLDGFQLWSMNADGTGRKKLVEQMEGNFLTNLIMDDGVLYYTAKVMEQTDQQADEVEAMKNHDVLVSCDLKTNKVSTLAVGSDTNTEFAQLYLSEGKLYYESDHWAENIDKVMSDIYEVSDITQMDENEVQVDAAIYSYDLKKKNTETIFEKEGPFGELDTFKGFDAACGLLFLTTEQSYWWKDGQTTTAVDSPIPPVIIDDVMAVFNSNENVIELYDKNSGLLLHDVAVTPLPEQVDSSSNMAPDETDAADEGESGMEEEIEEFFLTRPMGMIDDILYFNMTISSDMKPDIWMMKKEDLLAGNCVWFKGE